MKKTNKVLSILITLCMLMQMTAFAVTTSSSGSSGSSGGGGGNGSSGSGSIPIGNSRLTTPDGVRKYYDADVEKDMMTWNPSTPVEAVLEYEINFYAMDSNGFLENLNSSWGTQVEDDGYFDVYYSDLVKEINWLKKNLNPESKVYFRIKALPNSDMYIESYESDLYDENLTKIAYDYIASGMCGENAYWTLDKNGVATVSGTGAVDYVWDMSDYEDSIKTLILGEGITSCTYDYCQLDNLYIYNPEYGLSASIWDNNFVDCVVYAYPTSGLYQAILKDGDGNGKQYSCHLVDLSECDEGYRNLVDSKYIDAAKVISDYGIIGQLYARHDEKVTKARFARTMLMLMGEARLFVRPNDDVYEDLEVGTYMNGCAIYLDEVLLPESDTVYGANKELTYAEIMDVLINVTHGKELVGNADVEANIAIAGKTDADKVTYAELAQMIYNALATEECSNYCADLYAYAKFVGSIEPAGYENYTHYATLNGKLYTLYGELLEEGYIVENVKYEIFDKEVIGLEDDSVVLYVTDADYSTELPAILTGVYSTYDLPETSGYSADFKINNGAAETNNVNVSLTLMAEGYTKYKIGNGTYKAITASPVAYVLDNVHGAKTIEVTFSNADGSKTKTVRRTINLNNLKTITYMVNGQVFKTVQVGCGLPVPTLDDIPNVDGYSFDGWEGIPDVMPNNNITVTAKLSVVENIAEGTCGATATWGVSPKGVLTIKGTGEVAELDGFDYELRMGVKEVVIKDGIEAIGDYVLNDMNSAEKVTIGKTVKVLGAQFMYGSVVKSVTLPINVEEIKEGFCGDKAGKLEEVIVYNKFLAGAEYMANLNRSVRFLSYSGSTVADVAESSGHDFESIDPDFTINDGAEETTNRTLTIKLNEYAVNDFTQYKLADGDYKVVTADAISYQLPNVDGTYDVTIMFTNSIFEIEKTQTIVYNNKHDVIYKVNGQEFKRVSVGTGNVIPEMTDIPKVEGYKFVEWEAIPEIMPDADVVINAVMVKVTTITGIVKIDGAAVADAEVSVPGVTVKTDAEGKFVIADYPCGDFMITVTKDGMSKVISVSATEANTAIEDTTLSTVSTTATLAQGVKTVDTAALETVVSEEDKTYAETVGNTVTVNANVAVSASNANIASVKATKYSTYTDGIILDITIEKVYAGERTETQGVTETDALMQFKLEVPTALVGMTEYVVLREHGGVVDEIKTTPNANGEYITVIDGVITIYAKKFSAYALIGRSGNPGRTGGGGSLGGVSMYTITFETNGANAIEPQKVAKNAKVVEPKEPVKEGYTFAGWYADELLVGLYDFNTKVIRNTTLYAKWVEGTEEPEEVVIVLTIDQLEATINGEKFMNDTAPIIVNDRTMLPIRFIAEKLGAKVDWDAEARTATVTFEDIVIVIAIDSAIAMVNDEEVELDSPAFINNDRTYLPLRFIMENLGADVDWDAEGRIVTIRK